MQVERRRGYHPTPRHVVERKSVGVGREPSFPRPAVLRREIWKRRMTLETFRDGSWIRTGEERLMSHANCLARVHQKFPLRRNKPGSGELMNHRFAGAKLERAQLVKEKCASQDVNFSGMSIARTANRGCFAERIRGINPETHEFSRSEDYPDGRGIDGNLINNKCQQSVSGCQYSANDMIATLTAQAY